MTACNIGYVSHATQIMPAVTGQSGCLAHAAGLQARTVNASSPWIAMDNTFGAVWEANNFPEPPLVLRVTNSVGEKVGII
jgi:hypothetical protein